MDHNVNRNVNRTPHLTVALAAAALLALLLILAVDAQLAAYAAGDTIKVPDDYPTIQGAIDAAAEGDEVWVTREIYHGSLFIDKGLTLLGGWNQDFTARNAPTETTIIPLDGLGRGISITTATSDTIVTIDGFTIRNGDATGLGGCQVPSYLAEEILRPGPATGADSPTFTEHPIPAEHLARLQASLTGVVDQGLYPGGGAAYKTMLERVERHIVQSQQSSLQPRSAAGPSQDGTDCGGGIYSSNASLHLLNSVIEGSVASLTGSGFGGGVYVGGSAPSGTRIAGNTFLGNIASTASDTPGAGYIFGDGGGLYVTEAPEAVIEDNTFERNVGSNGSGGQDLITFGRGGGLSIFDSADVVVRRNKLVRNTAAHGWDSFAPQTGGGGASLFWAHGATVADNLFRENLGALNGGGEGGGLWVVESPNVLISGNEVAENWVSLVGRNYSNSNGGGIALVQFQQGISVTNNIIQGNIGTVSGPIAGLGMGGGLYIDDGDDVQVTGNTIAGNMANQVGIGVGGGIRSIGVHDMLVAENNITDNVGSLVTEGGYGGGGGLQLNATFNCTIRNNLFRGNTGAGEGRGVGGGGISVGGPPWDYDPTDIAIEGNLFLDNQASADPAGPSSPGGACFVLADGFTFTNNVIAGNRGADDSALYLMHAPNGDVTNNTLVGNRGAGVLLDQGNSTPITLTNNIVVSHTVGISVTEGATATVRYTLWHGNDTDIGGSGTISHTHPVSGTPGFVEPAADDYHLTLGSAAVNAGDPTGVPPAPDHDRDGVARPQGTAVDIGAYEWQGHYQYLPLALNRWQPLIGWAVGNKADGYSTILHTTDGGSTWTRQGSATDVPNTDLLEVSAVDAENAWVVGSDAILRTRDGGLTWEAQTLPPDLPAGFELHGIKALDANTVYVVGPPSVLLQTTDGATWTQMPVGADVPGNLGLDVVDAVDTQHVWTVGSIGDRVTPAIAFYDGVEWHMQPAPAFTNPESDTFIGVSAIDQSHVWAVGGFSMPLVTTADGGATWQASDHPLYPWDMNRVVAVNLTTGWTSGDDGTVKYTTDAGATWYDVSLPGAYLFGVTAMDEHTAWVVGLGMHGVPPGIIARTRDAQHWEVQSDPSWPNMNGISFVGARR